MEFDDDDDDDDDGDDDDVSGDDDVPGDATDDGCDAVPALSPPLLLTDPNGIGKDSELAGAVGLSSSDDLPFPSALSPGVWRSPVLGEEFAE